MTVSRDDALLIVFAKAPIAGLVNTRLTPDLSIGEATALQDELIRLRMRQFGKRQVCPLELWCAPDSRHPVFVGLQQGYQLSLREQQGANLGERMCHAFADGLDRYERVVLIGTDAPIVDGTEVCAALDALDHHDLVVTPAEDGGYVLIGMRRLFPALFENINWGGPEVMDQTRERYRAAGVSALERPTLWDIDRIEDLARYRQLGGRLRC